MRRLALRGLPLLGILFAFVPLPTLAKIPQPASVPASLESETRHELNQKRAQLLERRNAIRAKVDNHNQRCRSVRADTSLAAECSEAMGRLQGEIAAYVQAVKNFNRMVQQAAAGSEKTLASPILTEKQEIELGRKMAGELETRMTFVTDPRVVTYMQGVVDRLARHSTRRGIAYKVKVCTDCVVPGCFFACSLPGGAIYINSALIQKLSNEAELAAVLAHEVAHVAARHQSQNIDDYVRASGLSVLAAGPLWPIAQPAVFMKFKRDQEREADRLAMEILYQAKIKPTGLITFFEKIRRMRPRPGMLEAVHDVYFSSHPSEQERIQNLGPLLADPRFNQIRGIDSAEFHTIQRSLTSP